MIPFNPLMKVDDDGQYIPEARAWSLEKYKLVGSYCDIFTTGMKWLEVSELLHDGFILSGEN